MEKNSTSLYKGQAAFRSPGKTKCVYHKTVPLFWYCETCYDLICPKCVNSVHKSHTITELSQITPANKRKIEEFIEEKQKELIEIKHEIISTQESTEHLSLREDSQDENDELLNVYMTELKIKHADLKEHLKQCKETLQSGTDIQVFDLVKGLHTNPTCTSPAEKPNLCPVEFSPNSSREEIPDETFGEETLNPYEHSQSQQSTGPDQSTGTLDQRSPNSGREYMKEKAFGIATSIPSGKSQRQPSTSLDQSEETSVEEMQPSSELQCSEKGSTDTCDNPENVLLPQVKIISSWKSPRSIICNAICSSGDDAIWTSDCLNYKLTHLTCQGKIQDEIESANHTNDNCLSPTTNNLWTCSKSAMEVMELISGTLTERFKTKDGPRCLCVTSDEHILVGTKNRITEYTAEGKPGIATKSTVFSPWRISQCPLSGNVAVVDRDLADDGGKEKPVVIGLDRQLKEIYRYGKPQQIRVDNSCSSFDPWDVTYDSLGFLIIADFANNRLLMLNGEGQYLRLLYTDDASPRAVCVDSDGILWAVFGILSSTHQMIKRLQYISV